MRPVFVREFKELSLPGFLLAVAAGIVGANATGPLRRQFDDLLMLPIIGGLALGCVHGVIDRVRHTDLFSLHRPVPAGRMELARTLAGVTVAAVAVLVLVVSHRYATEVERDEWLRIQMAGVVQLPPSAEPVSFDHLGGGEVLLVVGCLLASWAIARFAAGSARPRWVPVALVILPLGGWSFMSRAESGAVVALGLAALFSAGSWLCLVEGRK